MCGGYGVSNGSAPEVVAKIIPANNEATRTRKTTTTTRDARSGLQEKVSRTIVHVWTLSPGRCAASKALPRAGSKNMYKHDRPGARGDASRRCVPAATTFKRPTLKSGPRDGARAAVRSWPNPCRPKSAQIGRDHTNSADAGPKLANFGQVRPESCQVGRNRVKFGQIRVQIGRRRTRLAEFWPDLANIGPRTHTSSWERTAEQPSGRP